MPGSPPSASGLSKRHLLLSALKLFSEEGIDAVSMRMINREAGAKNNSALHYHFGSKEGVLEALMEFICEWLIEARERDLQSAELLGASDAVPVREIIRIFLAPHIRLLKSESWGYHAVRFLARAEMEGGPDLRAMRNRYSAPGVARFRVLLQHALPHIPEQVLLRRCHFGVASILQGLADHQSLKDSFLGDLEIELDELVEIYLDYNAAGLSA